MKKIIPFLLVLCLMACDLIGSNEPVEPIDLNTPGENEVGKSFDISIPIQNASINVKVVSLTVYDNLTIGLNIVWTMSVNPGYSITKYSDDGNDNMNLTDNFGNTYYMIDALNAAGLSVTLENGETCSGTFVYPAPNKGITTLNFNDFDNNKTLSISVEK